MTKRYVGVLLNSRLYNGIPSGRTGHEALVAYVAAASELGVVPCFLRLKDLRPGAGKTRGYVWENTQFVKKTIPMPAVVHNRAIYKKKKLNDKLARLAAKGVYVYNGINRHGKARIHRLLMENKPLRIHLPETMEATPVNIRDMMRRHDELILKPDSGSIGQGVMMLRRGRDGGWLLETAATGRNPASEPVDLQRPLPKRLLTRIYSRRYLVQQRLPLATWEGRPFDIRVSVQRGSGGHWQITGMVGKVAAERSYLTNVARGGMVMTVDDLLAKFPSLDPDAVKAGIGRFALRVAMHLGRRLPRLADLGLDVGITEAGFPMFIECNGRDLRYSFLRGGLVREWLAAYATPLAYGAWLLDSGAAAKSREKIEKRR